MLSVALFLWSQMVALYQDPEGSNVFSKTLPTVPTENDVEHLRMKVSELERRLSQVFSIGEHCNRKLIDVLSN